jgi:hypothetical protein
VGSTEQLPKSTLDLRWFIGLGHKPSSDRQIAFKHICAARGHNQSHRRPAISNHARQSKPVHGAWHLNIGEDRSNVIPAFQNSDGFVSISGRKGFKAGLRHHVHCVHANEPFVLHHKHDWPLTGNRSAHLLHH